MRRLGVDFGASETVVAEFSGSDCSTKTAIVLSEPNFVHITDEGTRIWGQEIIDKTLEDSESTARHLRHFILRNSPLLAGCDIHTASYKDLGREFLVSLIRRACICGDDDVNEIVFSVPENAPPHYHEWLASVAAESGIPEYSFMSEIAAAAQGYGISGGEEKVILLIDVGVDALEVTVAILRQAGVGVFHEGHIIARTVADTGTHAIDKWIAEAVLIRCCAAMQFESKHLPQSSLSASCRTARVTLSSLEETTISVDNVPSGDTKTIAFTRADLNTILIRNGLYAKLDQMIEQAVLQAQSRGGIPQGISVVLMTGCGSFIPMIRSAVQLKFGSDRVRCDLPCSATALGLARYSTATGKTRSLERDYALRYWDADVCRHEFRYIARKGTVYPTRQDTARVLISAAYDGQTHLGIALYAFGDRYGSPGEREIELVTDPDGIMRCMEQPMDIQVSRSTWINEMTPTILVATPPGRKGDVRFELVFRIDLLGILRLSARDVLTGERILENHACVKLT